MQLRAWASTIGQPSITPDSTRDVAVALSDAIIKIPSTDPIRLHV